MKTLEIFSGAGGLAKGLELAGFDPVALVERDQDACASLRLNFPAQRVIQHDIVSFDLQAVGAVDLVAGGPPCQPFSLGGKHGAHQDQRDMFPYAIKAVATIQPKAFIFENVKGLLRSSFSAYFEYIILRLSYPDFPVADLESWESALLKLRQLRANSYQGLHYSVAYKLLDAADYGVPQRRERVIIVGVRSDLKLNWQFPIPTHTQDRLAWEKYVSGEYWARHSLPVEVDLKKTKRLQNQYGLFAPEGLAWQTVRDGLAGVPNPNSDHGIADHIIRNGARSYPGHTGSELDQPSKALKAGGHGVPGGENMLRYSDGGVRYFTVYEAKLIQTFPAAFQLSGAWSEAMRQIGNAVPVRLAEVIGKQLFQLLNPTTDNMALSQYKRHAA